MSAEGQSIEQVEVRVQQAQTRRERHARISGILYPALVVIIALILWEAVTHVVAIPAYILPPPSQIAVVMYEKMPLLIKHGWVSTTEIVLGFLLSVVVGIPLALATFLWPAFARSVYPLLVSSQAVPKMAVAPLFIVWFGFGQTPKLLLAFLIAFFPIMLDTTTGLQSVRADTLMLARSIGLGSARTFLRIQLPQALPSIFSGLKIGATLSVLGVLVAEFLGATGGLGYLVITATGMLDTVLLFSALVVIAVLGLVVYGIVSLAEHLAIGSWYGAQLRAGSGGPH